MSERLSFSADEVIPGIDWPEPIQPELPFDALMSQWSDNELMELLDNLHTDLDELEVSGQSDTLAWSEVNKVFTQVWDLAIDRGLVSCKS